IARCSRSAPAAATPRSGSRPRFASSAAGSSRSSATTNASPAGGATSPTLPTIDDVFDVVFLDAANKQYEELFGLAREKLEPGALVIADDVVLHADTLRAYSEARQADPTLLSTTVPLDRGLELSVVLR